VAGATNLSDTAMNDDAYLRVAARVGVLLHARGETVAVAESSAGGLISAALLAVPGASRYFLGGAAVYTTASKQALMGVTREGLDTARASTETHALVLARAARERVGATWGIGESGAAGPTGNRYGDDAGHCCVGVAGAVEQSLTLETGSPDRWDNMCRFAAAALQLLEHVLEGTR